jgi:flavin reductase (DIM6/NTAB) family NADH-FMN oxidoreductase RutF/rubredoxin
MDSKVFHKVSYGLYVIGSCSSDGSRLNAQIANTLLQVSAHPEMVSVALHKDNLTHELVEQSGVFSACILDIDAPMEHIGRFGFRSGRDGEKLEGLVYRKGDTGAPIVIPHTVGALEAEVVHKVDASTHTLFVARVTSAEMIGGGTPLTYEHYHLVKKGKSPAHAPVSQVDHDDVPEKAAFTGAQKYRCGVCGYTYDPVSEGTPFEDLPEGFTCPVCGAPRATFEPV